AADVAREDGGTGTLITFGCVITPPAGGVTAGVGALTLGADTEGAGEGATDFALGAAAAGADPAFGLGGAMAAAPPFAGGVGGAAGAGGATATAAGAAGAATVAG